MQAPKQARLEWTAVLRRQATFTSADPPEDGYSAFEVICRKCGDDPSLDYREVSPMLQRLRGPYWLAPGVEAYENHLAWHQKLPREARPEQYSVTRAAAAITTQVRLVPPPAARPDTGRNAAGR